MNDTPHHLSEHEAANRLEPIRAKLEKLEKRTRHFRERIPPGSIDGEHLDLERQRERWQLAQKRLAESDRWACHVTAKLDDFDYAKKGMALPELGATGRVWSMDHNPR